MNKKIGLLIVCLLMFLTGCGGEDAQARRDCNRLSGSGVKCTWNAEERDCTCVMK